MRRRGFAHPTARQMFDGGKLLLRLFEKTREPLDHEPLLDHHGIEIVDRLLGMGRLAFQCLETPLGFRAGHCFSSCMAVRLAVLSYDIMLWARVGLNREKSMFVVAGESLVDLVRKPHDGEGAPEFAACPGGSPYNCARALGLLGIETGFLCPISNDGFGDALLAELAEAGVVPLLERRSTRPTALAVMTPDASGLPRYTFYREGAAERDLDRASLIAALPARVNLFQIGGFLPVVPEDAAIWEDVVDEAARRNALVSMDPNVRPALVSDFSAYTQRLSRFLDRVHVVKMSDEDIAALAPGASVEDYVRSLLARPNCRLVVVTHGEAGAIAYSRSARAEAGIFTPPRFGDTVGAGDCLMAGVLAALSDRGALSPAGLDRLTRAELASVLQFGAVVAGLNCGHNGCHPPRRAEVDAALADADVS